MKVHTDNYGRFPDDLSLRWECTDCGAFFVTRKYKQWSESSWSGGMYYNVYADCPHCGDERLVWDAFEDDDEDMQ